MLKYLVLTTVFVFLFACKSKQKGNETSLKSEQKYTVEAQDVFFEAISAKIKNDPNLAIQKFNECLKMPGAKDAVHFELANLYLSQSNINKAAFHIQEAVNLVPNNKWYLTQKVEIFKLAKDWNKVEMAFLALIKYFPNEINYKLSLADYYLSSKQTTKTLDIYDKIEKQFGVHEKVNHNKFLIYKEFGEHDKALQEIDKLIQEFPLKPGFYVDKANFYYQKNNEIKAKEVLNEGFKIMPNQPDLAFGMGDLFFHQSQPDSAAYYYAIALKNYEFSIQPKMQILDEFYKYAAKDTTKLYVFKNLLNDFAVMYPEGYKANKYLSTHYLKVKDLPKAKNHMIIALNDKKNVLDMWETLISIDLRLKDFLDMENHSTEAIEYFPTQPLLFFYKALAKENQDKLQQAAEAYENGLSMIFDNSSLKFNFLNALGDLHHKMKNYAKSDMYFEQLLDLDPTNALALNNHAYYLSLRNEKLEYALQLAERALKKEPQNPSYLDTYGWILYQKGDYAKAIKYLLDAEQLLNEQNNEIYEHIAETYLKLGKTKEAQVYKQKIKK